MWRDKAYKEFVESVKTWSNAGAFASCECPVPRNENGWPTMKPEQMDNMQVLYEAFKWRSTARDTSHGTVGHGQWMVYTNELIRRGLMDTDCQHRYDIYKILEKGWNDLPPGPIIVDPVILKPIVVDPKKASQKVVKSQNQSPLRTIWGAFSTWIKGCAQS